MYLSTCQMNSGPPGSVFFIVEPVVLKCDLHERILDPNLVPFSYQYVSKSPPLQFFNDFTVTLLRLAHNEREGDLTFMSSLIPNELLALNK